MTAPIAYTVVFRWDGMPASGSGPMSTVWTDNGILPKTIIDPIEQNTGEVMRGTWLLNGVDEGSKLAIYDLIFRPARG